MHAKATVVAAASPEHAKAVAAAPDSPAAASPVAAAAEGDGGDAAAGNGGSMSRWEGGGGEGQDDQQALLSGYDEGHDDEAMDSIPEEAEEPRKHESRYGLLHMAEGSWEVSVFKLSLGQSVTELAGETCLLSSAASQFVQGPFMCMLMMGYNVAVWIAVCTSMLILHSRLSGICCFCIHA